MLSKKRCFKCSKCNGEDFEMYAEVKASGQFDIIIVDGKIFIDKFVGTINIKEDGVMYLTESLHCKKCGTEIEFEGVGEDGEDLLEKMYVSYD